MDVIANSESMVNVTFALTNSPPFTPLSKRVSIPKPNSPVYVPSLLYVRF